ncbi:MAG: glycosyltransferase family 2 protein [Candidatus Dormibacter sp.]
MDVTTTLPEPRVRRGSLAPAAPAVSIIVLVTNDTSRLRRCLASIDEHRPASPVSEVLVVANGTPDDELQWLSARDDLVLLAAHVNLGFGGGCNWAAHVAAGQRLLFMNDDATATAGWLDELGCALDDVGVGVAGSRILLANGTLQEAGGVVWRDGTTSGVGRGMDPNAPEYTTRRDVDYVSFCSTMVARQTWNAVGGFDPRYFPAYYEDTDFCLTARSLGWRVVCEPRSVVVHEEGRSTRPSFKRFLTRRNRELFVAKWRGALAAAEPPPSLTSGQRAVLRALDRTSIAAREGIARQSSPAAASQPGNSAPAIPAGGGVDQVAALRRMQVINDAFIDALSRELDSNGPTTAARRVAGALRTRAGGLLTRYPRLSHLVRTVIVSVGNRD